MKKIISYPISAAYYIVYTFILLFFHPLQWLALNVFGYQAHKKVVDVMNFWLMSSTYLLGTTYKIIENISLSEGTPIIFVANHQSLFDISPIGYFMRRYHPKFISKIELGKGIPSISYNLKKGGSVLIDRKNPKQAIPEIKKMAQYIEENKRSVLIFPEGTRSKTGEIKPFSETGLKILCKFAPSAYIVPITINNSYKIMPYGMFPLGLGNKLEFIFHEPLAIQGANFEELLAKTEQTIVKKLK